MQISPDPGAAPSPVADRPFRGVPGPERQRQRREALLDAGLEVIAEHGAIGVTIERLCQSAHLNKRYFFESFGSPDQLIQELLERELEGLWTGVGPLIAIHGYPNPRPPIEYFCEFLMSEPRRIRLLYSSYVGRRANDAYMNRAVEHWLMSDQTWSGLPHDAGLARLLAHSFTGAAVEVLTAWADGALPFETDRLVDILVGLFQRIVPPDGDVSWALSRA